MGSERNEHGFTRRGLAGRPRPDERSRTSRNAPALVVSVDIFNHGAAELVVVIPITSKAKGIPLHVEVTPPEGGLTMTSYAECEDVRSISTSRLVRRLGKVSGQTIESVEDRLRIL